MKKDFTSYKKHDSDFKSDGNTLKKTLEIINTYDEVNQFKLLGFDYAIRLSNPLPKIHVDIGSGNGWLVKKTSPLFEKVIGIEPSETGVQIAKEVNHDKKNVSFLNKDMVDGLKELSLNSPVFITTATVLSHIEDFYVEEFLKQVNNLPIDSVLCFDERYDKNIHWKLWHIRNKDWWRKNLPNWQLIFFDLENNGYASTIFGTCLGQQGVLKTKQLHGFSKFFWDISKFFQLAERLIKKVYRNVKFY